MSPIMSLASELAADARSAKALPALWFGAVCGTATVIFHVCVGMIVHSGPLAPFVSEGITMALFGGFAVCLVVALAGRQRGAMAAAVPASAVMLAAIGATIGAGDDSAFLTAAVTLGIGTMAAGLFFLLLGRLRLSNLLRFVPYSVTAGYISGAGAVLCLAALPLMAGSLDRQSPASFLEPASWWTSGSGAAFGVALFLATNRWKSIFVRPLGFLLAAALIHLGLTFFEVSADDARAAGMLLADIEERNSLLAAASGIPMHVDWAVVARQIPDLLAVVLVTLLCAATSMSAVERAADRDLDWDREFRVTGWGCLIAGTGGGLPGCVEPLCTTQSTRSGADTRLTGVLVAVVAGSALLLSDRLLSLVPVPLVGGLLFSIGAELIHEWLVRSRARLPWTEYGILLLIAVTIASLGFLEGIGVGVAVTIVFFTVRLARVDSVEAEFTARERRSNRSRPIADQFILAAEGERIRAYRLRGYLFFGSAHALATRLNRSLRAESPPTSMLLDFGAVSGLDFSAINTLSRFIRASHDAGVRLVLSAAPGNCRKGLERNLPSRVHADLVFEPDADRAMERCEDIVIAVRKSELRRAGDSTDPLLEHFAGDMESHLDRRILFEDMASELREDLEVRDYAAGEVLVEIGAPQNGLQLVLMGRASVHDAAGMRIRQCGPGDAIEVRGAFEPYTAPVATVAEEPCRTLVLTREMRRRLEEHRVMLMLELYGYLLTAEAHAATLQGPDAR